MIDNFLNYLEVILLSFVVNVVPAFVPPTWLALTIYHLNHPLLDTPIVALAGVAGSVGGRLVMYYYSKILGKYMPSKYADNLKSFRGFLEKRKRGLFFGTLIYSLGPLPSNFLFIAAGIARTEILPVLGGFALGRGISYILLIYASLHVFSVMELVGGLYVKELVNVLGIIAGLAIVFVDWRKLSPEKPKNEL